MNAAETETLKEYSKREIMMLLGRIRKRPMTEPTFYRWLDINGIQPKWRYPESDVSRLKKTCIHFNQGGTRATLPKD